MGRRLFCATMTIGFAAAIFTAWPAHAGDAWNQLVEELKSSNPGLTAKRKTAESLRLSASAKMAWDDPMAEAGLMGIPVDSFRFDQEEMTQKVIGVTQMVPSLEKRTANRRFTEAQAVAADAEANMAERGLVAELKKNVFELHYLDEALATIIRNQTILDELIIISNAKYAAGKGALSSVIQAQLERTMLDERKLAISEKRDLVRVKINRLLNRKPDSGFVIPPGVITEPSIPNLDGIWEKARKNSPMARLAAAELEMARTMVERERGETGLDMSFTAEYAQRDDAPMERPDLVSVKAAVTFPLWRAGKQDKYIAAAVKEAESASDRLEDALVSVRAEMESAVLTARKEAATASLYNTGILPQATHALASARAAYQLDKADFLDLLMTEQALIDYELMAEEARMRLRMALAELEYITGAAMDEGEGDGR